MLSKDYATVKIGEFTIPLIGISSAATEDECELCHDIIHISELSWNEEGNQLLCNKCKRD